jgi:PTS system nitrogen regulatory IIA component
MNDPIALHEYMDESLVEIGLTVSSHKKLLQETAKLLSRELEDCKDKTIYHQLIEREKLGSTCIGNGVILPHSRSEHTSKGIISLITLTQPVEANNLEKTSVDIAFGLLVPTDATKEHLQILAQIAKHMSNDRNKQMLLSANSSEDAIELIKSWA